LWRVFWHCLLALAACDTAADGKQINYPAGTSLTVTGNITLYAKWDGEGITTPGTYTVTFNANGANGTVPAMTVNAGSGVTLPRGNLLTAIDFTTFAGWNTRADGSGINYPDTESIIPSGDITLYAGWVAVTGLANKLAWLQTNAQSGGNYTIEVNTNESIGPQTLSYSGRSDITITLRGTGANRTISLLSNGVMFTVRSGVTLILENNITLQCHK